MNIFSTIYQYQMDLDATGLISEFVLVFLATFFVGIRRCTERSPVLWKRTDYFYFSTTVLAAAIGIAEFTSSTWSKEIQSLELDRYYTINRLEDAAKWVSATCENTTRDSERMREQTTNRREGIIPPSSPKPEDNSDISTTLSRSSEYLILSLGHFSQEDCSHANLISQSFDEVGLTSAINTIVHSNQYISYILLYKIFSNSDPHSLLPSFDLEIQKFQVFVRKKVPDLLYGPIAHLKKDLEPLIEKRTRQNSKLYMTTIFRKLYPFLFGLGLGVRLARTHYDVKMAEKDVATKRKTDTGASLIPATSSPAGPELS